MSKSDTIGAHLCTCLPSLLRARSFQNCGSCRPNMILPRRPGVLRVASLSQAAASSKPASQGCGLARGSRGDSSRPKKTYAQNPYGMGSHPRGRTPSPFLMQSPFSGGAPKGLVHQCVSLPQQQNPCRQR